MVGGWLAWGVILLIRWLMGMLLAVGVVTLFWWLVSSRLSIPAWQVGAIPAAMAGGLIGTFDRQSGRFRLTLILLLAGFSTFLGSWYPVHAGLVASRAQVKPTTEQLLMEAIQRMEEENTDLESAEKPSRSVEVPWRMSIQVATEQAKRSPWPVLGHGAIAILIAWQAARMASLSVRARLTDESRRSGSA